MKKFLLTAVITGIFALLLFSCEYFFPEDEGAKEGEERKFWAYNFTIGKDYQFNARLLAKGSRCNVWVEIGDRGSPVVNGGIARQVASTYDNRIYEKMMAAFGFSGTDNYGAYNTMSLADRYGDGDGKLCILLLDIKDGYEKGKNDSYVAGYFWSGNFYDEPGSNKSDMIYIDTYPAEPAQEESNMTLAHEMQHLMNFITTVYYHRDSYMDTWIDEGLSAAAEWVYAGRHNRDRIDWFNDNGMKSGDIKIDGLINRGNNFFIWGNRERDNQYASLDDYATVYLFFQWLRIHGGSGIYKKIITSEYTNHTAVVENMDGFNTWDSLLETWLAANHINSATGLFGYKGESGLNVKVTYAPTNTRSVPLYPGEGVYSLANTEPETITRTNIVYKYVSGGSVVNNFSAGSTLLTYNKSTIIIAPRSETGTVTGAAPPANSSVSVVTQGRSVTASRPYRIDARDLLRRNGGERITADE